MVSLRCANCDRPYDPVETRWVCPHCHWRDNCCEGEPVGESGAAVAPE